MYVYVKDFLVKRIEVEECFFYVEGLFGGWSLASRWKGCLVLEVRFCVFFYFWVYRVYWVRLSYGIKVFVLLVV